MKTPKMILLLILGVAVFWGCQKGELRENGVNDESQVAIELSTGSPLSMVSKVAVDKWNDSDVNVFGLKRKRGASVGNNAYDFTDPDNFVDYPTTATVGSSASLEVYADKDEKVPYYYTEGHVYDFYGYHLGGATAADKKISGDAYCYYVTFLGNNDLMYADTDRAEDILTSDDPSVTEENIYSAWAARRNVHPTLVFHHALTRLNFIVKGKGDKWHDVEITGVDVKSVNTGTLTVTGNDVGFVPSEENPVVLSLRTSTDEEFVSEDVTLNPDDITLGGENACLMIAPDMNEIEISVHMKHKDYEDYPLGDYTFTVKASDISHKDEYGNPVPVSHFEAGHAYDVYINVYGPEEIIINAQIAKWEDGGDYTYDPDEDFRPSNGTSGDHIRSLLLTYETNSADETIQLTSDPLISIAGRDNELLSIDYGDGQVGMELTHTFSEAGIYTVKMNFKQPIIEIEDNSFCRCKQLVGVTFPDSLESIGEYAFGLSGLRGNLVIPNNNVQIASYAFVYTGKYESVIIPYGTTFVGVGQFMGLKAKDFYMGTNIPDGLVSWRIGMYEDACLDNLIIGNKVSYLGEYAFSGNNYSLIKNVVFEKPSMLEYIGDWALCLNSEITTINLPPSIECISECGVFDRSPKLESINIENNRNYWTIDGVLYTFSETGARSILRYPEAKKGESFKDESVTCIMHSAFRDNKYLKEIHLSLFHGIADYAFMGCSNLMYLYGCDYPYNNNYAFDIYIGNSAFRDCSSLTEFTIAEAVDVIKASAFANCTNLAKIYCKSLTPPTLEDDEALPTFGNNAPGRLIYVPTEVLDNYKTSPGWSNYQESIVGFDFDD